MKNKRKLLCAAALVGVLGGASPVMATTLPLPWVYAFAGSNAIGATMADGETNIGSTTQSATYNNSTYGLAETLARPGVPFVSTYAQGLTAAYGVLLYGFEVNGPQGNQQIPVSMSGNIITSTQVQGNYLPSNDAGVTVNEGSFTPAGGNAYLPQTPYLITEAAGSDVQGPPVRSFNDQLLLKPNTPYTVQLSAYSGLVGNAQLVRAEADPTFSEVLRATADPYFKIDPSFLAANPGYSLDFSEGVDNAPVSVVPLPPGLPMFATGLVGLFGLAGFARMRKKAC